MRFPGFNNRAETVDPVTGVRTTTASTTPVTVAPAAGATTYDGRPAVVHDTATLGGQPHRDAPRDAGRTIDLERERNDAYQRGLRDGVRAKRTNPVLTILVLLLALLGIAIGVLAIINGSFSKGGAVLDRSAGLAAVEARDTGGELAQDAGAALQREGAQAEREAEAARP